MLILLIFCLIFTVIAFFGVKMYLHKRYVLKYVQHLPTTEDELPVIGIGHRFMGKSTIGIYNELSRMSETVTNPSRHWFGPTLIVVISSPEDMQTVLNSPHCLQKPFVYDFVNDNVGLFIAKTHIWKPTRKLLNPTFSNKIISSFVPIFNDKAKLMAENVEQFVDQKDPFDVAQQIFACTLDMVCATTLGVDLEFQREKNVHILECMEKYTEVVAERIAKVWLHWDFIYKRSKLCKIQDDLLRTIECLPRKIRQIKQKEFDESKSNSKHSDENEEFREPQIFVNELLRLQSEGLIDDKMVDDQIITMISGGNETSALTTSHVILMLAMHQDVQERVFQEIKSAHSSQYSETNAEEMTKLTYMEMVIRETMRILPVGPFLGRECTEDVKISNCTLPKNTLLLLAFNIPHRDKAVWGPNPEKFDPEHFLPEKMAKRHPYQYLPFSGGPRNCIGIKYAWLSMKIMISALLRRYKFTTDLKLEELVPKWDVTMKIVNRHMVKVEPRVY